MVKILFSFLSNLVILTSLCGQGELRSTCTDSTHFNIQESIAFYQGRLSLDSGDQVSYYSIGMGFYKLRDYTTAIQYFDKLEILNPEYPSLYSDRAICKLLIGNKLGACNDFGLSLSHGYDPEIMDGQRISQWVQNECPSNAREAYQFLYEQQMCPNFSYTGLTSNQISLSDFKGRYIILDIWATWCAPCLKDRAKFESIKSRFSENEGMVFLSISLDSNKELWKESVISDGFSDGQLWAGDDKQSVAFRLAFTDGGDGKILATVPQYVIIDPSGMILRKFHGSLPDLMKRLKIINRSI